MQQLVLSHLAQGCWGEILEGIPVGICVRCWWEKESGHC